MSAHTSSHRRQMCGSWWCICDHATALCSSSHMQCAAAHHVHVSETCDTWHPHERDVLLCTACAGHCVGTHVSSAAFTHWLCRMQPGCFPFPRMCACVWGGRGCAWCWPEKSTPPFQTEQQAIVQAVAVPALPPLTHSPPTPPPRRLSRLTRRSGRRRSRRHTCTATCASQQTQTSLHRWVVCC